jgi:ring-1,2-phenylacetyl-CoA epoxidase subunit PaaD
MVVDEVVQDDLTASASQPKDEGLVEAAWQALASVVDPEIPIVSIVELGIVRSVGIDGATLVVDITPTYSGCPATEAIMQSIDDALCVRGILDKRIDVSLAPAWTTDRIAPEAKSRLREFGVAPPHAAPKRVSVALISPLRRRTTVACPRCGSTHTRLVSQFGSTACKAHYRCEDCLEPFDYFKSL